MCEVYSAIGTFCTPSCVCEFACADATSHFIIKTTNTSGSCGCHFLRHLSERDSVSLVEEHIEEDLFTMLDSETDERIIRSVRQTLQRLLEAACPSFPSRWLHLCHTVVLATAATKQAGSGFQAYEESSSDRFDASQVDHVPMGEYDEGMREKVEKK
jgi:hypothetical protein